MKLYHYTTIDSLARILNSKSIKFNRLDQLDDLTESEEFGSFNPLKYTFSCSFTWDDRENIALWKMYANMETGVRLEFDSTNIFAPNYVDFPLQPIDGDIKPEPILTSIKSTDIVNQDFLLVFWMPICDENLGAGIHLKKVKYTDNIKDIYKNLVKFNPVSNSLECDVCEFGFYKSKYWEFQKEVRLLIYVIPNCQDKNDFDRLLSNERQLKTTSLFVPLSNFALDNLQIVLSPKTTDASRIIVESLTSNLSNISIRDSSLKHMIR